MAGSADDLARKLHGTTDAQVWARTFIDVMLRDPEAIALAVDEGFLIGWFANAIEVGRDAGARSEAMSEASRLLALAYRQREASDAEVARLTDLLAEGAALVPELHFPRNGGVAAHDWCPTCNSDTWPCESESWRRRATPVPVSSTVEPEATTQPVGPTVDTRTVGE